MRNCAPVWPLIVGFVGIAIGHAHDRAILGFQCLAQTRGLRIGINDLACMGVIGRYDDKRVAVFAGKIECGLHGFIQIDCFADLPARIGGMVLFVDGGTFHLKEKPFRWFSAGRWLSRSFAPVSEYRQCASH